MHHLKRHLEEVRISRLKPSDITLRAYNGHPSAPVNIYKNVPVCFPRKMVLIGIDVLDSQLDYNILLGRSYMYTMSVITYSIFQIMMFPHEDHIIIVDQLTYHDK